MNTKQLKAKVLDLAIHGKLLSPETVAELKKSPDYETADVLLEKIRKEKEEKIAKGELKRDKKDSYIFVGDDKRHYEKFADGNVKDIEDEIPFDVPEEWAWCRLGTIGEWKSGSTPNKKNLDYYENGTIPWLLTGDLNDSYITHIPSKITEKAYKETSLRLCPKDSVCIAMYGATIGKLGILSFPATSNQACCICSNFKGIKNTYLFFFLMQHKDEFIQQGFGGAQPNISKEKIIATLIPLPPIEEQVTIVNAINNLFAKIDSLNINTLDLKTCITQTKAKILDLAIHGKLVSQDTKDEPVSVLLEKLRAEKETKIAKGELKRDKNDSYIYKGSDNCYYQRFADGREEDISDEIPFEVPSNWTWTRIGAISNKITDGEHNTPKRVSTFQGFYLLSARNIQNGYISLNDVDYVDENEFIRIHKRCNPQKGDVLVSCSGSVGRCAVIEDDNKYVMVRSAAMISSNIINTKYLMYVIQSQELQNQIEDSSKQTAQANLFQAAIADLLIPLPPFNEQKRIVKNIEELYMKLELINQNID